jgi:hypothetical protein
MRSLLLLTLQRAAQSLRIADMRAHGTAPDKVIHPPSCDSLGAKPSRYQPSPSNPPQSGKRRRQWR